MNPIAPNIISTGIIRFTAAKASLPTQFDINIPSTTPYIEVNIIITIVGIVNLINFLYVKCSDNCIFIFPYFSSSTSKFSNNCNNFVYFSFILSYPNATSRIIIITKPIATPIVPIFECSPACDSGISSSTTT